MQIVDLAGLPNGTNMFVMYNDALESLSAVAASSSLLFVIVVVLLVRYEMYLDFNAEMRQTPATPLTFNVCKLAESFVTINSRVSRHVFSLYLLDTMGNAQMMNSFPTLSKRPEFAKCDWFIGIKRTRMLQIELCFSGFSFPPQGFE